MSNWWHRSCEPLRRPRAEEELLRVVLSIFLLVLIAGIVSIVRSLH